MPQSTLETIEPAVLRQLRAHFGTAPVPTWGATPTHKRKWGRMQPGACVLFTGDKKLMSRAELVAAVHDRDLAIELWPDVEDEPWEYVFFVTEPTTLDVPYAQFNRDVGYAADYVPQGLVIMRADAASKAASLFCAGEAAHLEEERQIIWAVESARASARGQGVASSAAARDAIEDYSMTVATAHYEALGYAVNDAHKDNPYDLRCTRGKELWHVEVKGTTTAGEEVLLTPREVQFARDHADQMILYILHSVELSGTEEAPVAAGGMPREIRPWHIDDGQLRPTGYSYRPPNESG